MHNPPNAHWERSSPEERTRIQRGVEISARSMTQEGFHCRENEVFPSMKDNRHFLLWKMRIRMDISFAMCINITDQCMRI